MSADVIQRCTRNGVVIWSQVAKQLGCSIERAKMLCGYPAPRQDPQQIAPEPDVDAMTDAEAFRSPYAKTDGLKALLMALLGRHSTLSCEQLAVMASSTPNSVRKRLWSLRQAGMVESDERRGRATPSSWWLTPAGKVATLDRPGSIGQGAPSAQEIAA